MLKAIIFDMDGVLVDTEPLHYKVDYLLLEELKIDLDYDYYKQFIGSTNTYLWTCIKEKFGIEYSVSELMEMADKKKDEIVKAEGFPEIEGVYEMITRLAKSGLDMAVASSSPLNYIEQVTGSLDIIKHFKKLVSGESVKNPKPAPDVFLKAAELLGVKPEECIVVEDSSNGAKAAKAAGMVCIGFVNPGSGEQDLSVADYLIENYECMDRTFIEMVYSHAVSEP